MNYALKHYAFKHYDFLLYALKHYDFLLYAFLQYAKKQNHPSYIAPISVKSEINPQSKGSVYKPRGQVRGRGVAQMSTLLNCELLRIVLIKHIL